MAPKTRTYGDVERKVNTLVKNWSVRADGISGFTDLVRRDGCNSWGLPWCSEYQRIIDKEEEPKVAARKHVQSFKGLAISNIGVVFVPVLQKEHWWCLTLDLRDECLWYIDSMFPDPVKRHRAILEKLGKLDVALNSLLYDDLRNDENELRPTFPLLPGGDGDSV
uniref:Uncharacterized protein n=1 Tax=Chenopodium quinoa TaxID=63459 RepID=A0A803MVQ3_CHEQI